MNRLPVYLLAFIFASFLIQVPRVAAQDFEELNLIQLEKQLNAILKTRLPEEKLYISAIVKLVEEEKLPRKLINTSFKYVMNKRGYAKSPFVYFVRVLQFQAKRDRIKLPPFDFKIYSQRR